MELLNKQGKKKRQGSTICFQCTWVGFCQEGLKRYTVHEPAECKLFEIWQPQKLR